jgi:hypothetical protein
MLRSSAAAGTRRSRGTFGSGGATDVDAGIRTGAAELSIVKRA